MKQTKKITIIILSLPLPQPPRTVAATYVIRLKGVSNFENTLPKHSCIHYSGPIYTQKNKNPILHELARTVSG